MTICKGVVKDNMVLLEAGAQLPDGAEVEVRLLERPQTRQEIFARVRTHRILCSAGMDEILAEARKSPSKGPAQPAREGQMGTAPAKGTVQSGKEPKTD